MKPSLPSCVLAIAVSLAVPASAQSVSVTALDTAVTQNFDALASSGTSSAMPSGWYFSESGTNANTLYSAGTGSGTGGDTYSFGAAGSTERALGGLLSGSLTPTIGAAFTNNTGATITRLEIAYIGEQWRLGTAARGADRIDFQYSLNAASLTTGTWVDVDALDFSSPVTTAPTGALDGNVSANRTPIIGAIAGLSIPNGATFWIRWTDFNVSGSDDGLAVDDFSLTASAPPGPTDPTGAGNASPALAQVGGTSLLTVSVTPGANPISTGLVVRADLTAIGGSATRTFFDDGTNGDATAGDLVFSYLATVGPATAAGTKTLPATITDAYPRSGSAAITLDVQSPPSPTVVISQIYGGGGNSGATYTNDFIELYNRGVVPVVVTGWSVQYASSSGTSWQVTPLTGTISPGQYYLVQEAAGTGGTVGLPTPDAIGAIPMSASAGKIALVSNAAALGGACPVSATIIDFVGFGTANCSETAPTPALSNTTAALRNGAGSVDTNNNLADFTVAAPAPRNSSGLPPTGLGAAFPASASPGETTLLTVAVTPGASPPSTTLAVNADLSPIGGPASRAFLDDGMDGDVTAGDGVFSFLATVGAVTTGSRPLSATVSDDLGRASIAVIPFSVEPSLSAIHDIQGPGLRSPVEGQFVATRGIVTAVKFNGFFVQTPDAQADTDPATSEGLFVFTGGTPSGLNAGDAVKVTGTVQEFVPSGDPNSPPATELIVPTWTVLSSGNVLPAPVTLTAADTSPTGTIEQLERFEGMRVHVGALRVIAPTQASFVDEQDAESTSNGVFYGVIDGIARPFREPGIEVPNPRPAGVPRFDANPERLRVDSDGLLGGVKLEVTTGALLSDVTGPLDYGFRTYTILPDPAAPPSVSGNASATPVPEPGANEFTVASFNMERFFDTVDDPGVGDPVLTSDAFANRLGKASLAIRNVMRTPDILGVEEVENLSTLQALATKVNNDAVAAGQPNPSYQAYLEEGHDVGGIDSGFLVKAARVSVTDVTQIDVTPIGTQPATYVNPSTGLPELLNDRPPLVLRAEVPVPGGTPFPVTIIVNHLRSLSGVDDATDGPRVRAKRAAQAEYLASLIQARQTAGERVVSVGDYNAYQFSDGYVDSLGTIRGDPTPAANVVLASPDLVNPDLTDLVETLVPEQRYSYSFDGHAQVLDHVLVSTTMLSRFSRFHYARNDADFPESYRNDPYRPERLSDHDMPVAYFMLPGAPVLTLLGPNPMTVECHTPFTDPGATAFDTDLGDLTAEIQVSGSVDANTVGSYVLTYSVSNGFLTTTMTRTVDVVDTTPPVVTLLGANPVTVELGETYTEDGASAFDTCAGDLTAQIVIGGAVNTSVVGSYPLTYTVSDGYNATQVTRTVTVVDRKAPEITTVSASPHVLWPPNGRMVPVTVTVSASDESGTVTCEITGISSDEPSTGHGSGRRSPDWIVTGALSAQLRAERDGRGDGRTYTIAVACRDASGNVDTGSTTVIVPHDKDHGGPGGHGHHDNDGCERQRPHPRARRGR
jgi:uncharacterized protein